MKKKILLGLILCSSVLVLNAQIYTPSGTIQGSSGSNSIGIGTSTPDPTRKIEIVCPTLSVGDYGMGIYGTLPMNYASFRGTASARFLTGGVWNAIGNGAGILGTISNLSELRTSNSGGAYAHGGAFSVSFSNFTGSFTTRSYVSGVSGSISGTISSYPSNVIISAVVGRDLIKGSGTLAGYFDGRVRVNGKIDCEEAEVMDIASNTIKTNSLNLKLDNAADYVFEDDYKLKSLEEVESFVKENKHLPGIPSKDEFKENGMDVSEMTNKLLEKVEELTLHMIELKKENELLKAEISGLK